MSHIGEAQLHEYLDTLERGGTGLRDQQDIERHLAECAECAAMLEEVQLVRDRASTLLREAAPAGVSMPPFEEIEARAHAMGRKTSPRAPRPAFRMRRLVAIGWAATIVAAVGLGWLVRGSFNFGSPENVPRPLTDVAAADARGADDVGSGQGGAATEEAPSLETRSRPSGTGPSEEHVSPPAADEQRLEMAAAPPEPAKRDTLAAPEPAPAAKAEAAARSVAGIPEREEAPHAPERGAVPEARPQLNEMFARATWSQAERADAERHVGGALHVVEGLPIDSLRVGEVGGRPAVIIGQTLPGGEPLEIIQWQPRDLERAAEGLVSVGAVSADEAPAVARQRLDARGAQQSPEAATSLVSRGDFLLALRARVAPDSLAALAARIQP